MDAAKSIATLNANRLLEAVGSVFGIVGALIMALRPEFAAAAWAAWLTSSVSLLLFARNSNLRWLATLQATFTIINVIGLYNSLQGG